MEIGHIAVIPQNTIINFICYIATVAQKGNRYEKSILVKLLFFIGMMMIVFIGINIYKNIFGDNIRHYSQYIFPCQGQITTLKG